METRQEKARRRSLWSNFKLTPEDWQKIDDFQNGVCFVCQKRQKSGNRLSVDHNHKNGLIRGLLCSQCNRLFGKIERIWNIEMVRKLLDYWLNPPAIIALGREVFGFAGRCGTKRHRKELRRQKKLVEKLKKHDLIETS